MKVIWTLACGVAALATAAVVAGPTLAGGGGKPTPVAAPQGAKQKAIGDLSKDNSILRVPANAAFPIQREVMLGVGRSLMVQFPMELRDVMISDPDKIDAVVQTSDRVFLIVKKPGNANVFFFDGAGNQIMNLEIVAGADLTSLDNLLNRLVPGASIKAELVGETIALTGSVKSPSDSQRAAEIAKQFVTAQSSSNNAARNGFFAIFARNQDKPILNMLTIEGEDQVMLKVTVAEINRTILKQMGVNLGASIASGNFANSFGTTNTFPLTAATLGSLGKSGLVTQDAMLEAAKGGQSLAQCLNIHEAVSPKYVGIAGLSGAFNSGKSCLSYVLRAMERHGLVRTLAEPTLTAVSGEAAKFLAGGEYPVPVSSALGTIGIEFKEFGVGLTFTPVVLSEGRISIKLETTVSELSNDGALVLSGVQIPSLRKRSATSTVELPSGGSLAMAGLISDTTRQNIEGFPGLKDVPVLGALFRSKDYLQSETELVIIVTPYTVRPTARQNLGSPSDGLAPASDLKQDLLGQLNRVYGKGKPAPDGGLKGSHGFIVD